MAPAKIMTSVMTVVVFAAVTLTISVTSAQNNPRINYTALKTECQTDPTGIGLTTPYNSGQDATVANLLNVIRATVSIRRSDIAAADVANAIRVTDYTALPGNPNATQLSTERRFLSWFEAIISVPEGRIRLLNDDGSDTPVIANFRDMFASGTSTMQRLTALATRTGTRGEQLFGADVTITASDIAQARSSQ